MNPKVSIIMATYNRATYILESIQSIQNQTFKDWECLIVDDGGTDNTADVLAPIVAKDTRFKYVTRPSDYQKGLPGSRNFGLDIVKGDFIIFFDDDDIVHPQNLELCVKELTSDPNMSFCRYVSRVFKGQFDYQFDYSKDYSFFYLDVNDLERILKNELQINSCSVIWKKECFHNNRFQENLMYAEELELYTRLISLGYTGISIEKCLFYGRKHPDSNTGEFYNENPIRRASYANASIMIIKNLDEKKMLSRGLIRYFVIKSHEFKDTNLFYEIMNAIQLSNFDKMKWTIFYNLIPLRLFFYKIKKGLLNKSQPIN